VLEVYGHQLNPCQASGVFLIAAADGVFFYARHAPQHPFGCQRVNLLTHEQGKGGPYMPLRRHHALPGYPLAKLTR
jgi:hypothetical protein